MQQKLFISFVLVAVLATAAFGQTTEFTYQGSLKDNAAPANANYDFEFALFDALSGGNQVGATLTRNMVIVTNGLFAVKLDFGSQFPGANRYLEIRVRLTGQPGITTLGPRQLVNSAPYSVKSLSADNATNATNATTATNASQLGGVAASQYVLTGDTRLSDARMPIAGSANYVQNTTNQQASSNFNISGDGFTNGYGGVGTTSNTFIGSPARLTVVQQTSGQWAQHIGTNNFANGNSFGLLIDAGTNSSDEAFRIRNQAGAGSLLSVHGNGFVGIGTATPISFLHLSTNNTASNSLVIENTDGASRQIILSNYGSVGGGDYWSGLNSSLTSSLLAPNLFVLRSTGGLAFSGSSAAEHMRILANGNVGIGVASTPYKFQVLSTTPNAFAAHVNTQGLANDTSFGLVVSAGTTANDISFQARNQAGSTLFAVRGDGHVGIGTDPFIDYKLHVNGQDSFVGLQAEGSSFGVVGYGGTVFFSTGVYGEGRDRGVAGFSNTGVGVTARSTSGNLVEGSTDSTHPKFHITNDGTYVAGSDFAEALPALGERTRYEPGDVLVVSTRSPGKVEKTNRPYDTRVAGIYSTRPGILGADKNGTSRVDADDVPVAIVGIVPTKVSAMNGPIRVGDLLTTSNMPGYAMRCGNRVKCVGAIVGKALEPISTGNRVIKVLVMLR